MFNEIEATYNIQSEEILMCDDVNLFGNENNELL